MERGERGPFPPTWREVREDLSLLMKRGERGPFPPHGERRERTFPSYLERGEHAAGHEDQEPEVHVEELGDLIGHEAREYQQQETHAQPSQVFPPAPGGEPETRVHTSTN